jgi:adenylate cyclase
MTMPATLARFPALLGRARLVTGLVLFAYVTLHLVNHAAGLVSLAAMERIAAWVYALLHVSPVAWLIYGALGIHFLLALHAIHRRQRFWPMPWQDALQLILGLSIVPLLTAHVVGTRVAGEMHDVVYTHTLVLIELGWGVSFGIPRQLLAMLIVWVHGCCGVYAWLRLKPAWPRMQPALHAAALLLPAFAIGGVLSATQEIAIRAETVGWIADQRTTLNAPDTAARAELGRLRELALVLWAGGLVAALTSRRIRLWREGRAGRVRIAYPDGRRIDVPRGLSVLEASHMAGIPHASVCGGRGRCSTCRIRVGEGGARQPPPSPEESAVLARIGAAPAMRLACQLRPVADLAVAPLLPARAPLREARRRIDNAPMLGLEREIAVLFADLRDFTRLAEHKLPFDVVFILNRYFEAMGREIEGAGGHVDKFIGDGVMALFGTVPARGPVGAAAVPESTALAARAAVDAARRMSLGLRDLNASLAHDLERPLRLGIGIHVGPVILGEMGYGRATGLTAIGDTVNLASRIEALCKPYGAELVISAHAAEVAGLAQAPWRRESATIPGRGAAIDVLIVPDAASLPPRDAISAWPS